jgi:hypothetical protein
VSIVTSRTFGLKAGVDVDSTEVDRQAGPSVNVARIMEKT